MYYLFGYTTLFNYTLLTTGTQYVLLEVVTQQILVTKVSTFYYEKKFCEKESKLMLTQ